MCLSVNTLYQVPVGREDVLDRESLRDYILGNWQINNIFVAHTGQVFTPVTSSDIANTGNGFTYETLDLVGNPNQISKRTTSEYFNTAAYETPAQYTHTEQREEILSARQPTGIWMGPSSASSQFMIR
jgi:hypothetical protein